jgi:hexokinase
VSTNNLPSDRSTTLEKATQVFASRHPSSSTPSHADILALQKIASHVSVRASALVAAGVHALWSLRLQSESLTPHQSSHTLVAYNGSVLENYPSFKENCQGFLDALVQGDGGKKGSVELVFAEESSLLGAAVAGAVAALDG